MNPHASLRAVIGPLVGDRYYPMVFPQTDGAQTVPAARGIVKKTIPHLVLCRGDQTVDDVEVEIRIHCDQYDDMRDILVQAREAIEDCDPPCVRLDDWDEYEERTRHFVGVLRVRFQPSTRAGSP